MSWPNKVYSQSMVPKYTKYNNTSMLFRYGGFKRGGKYLDASGNGNNTTSTVSTTACSNRGICLSQLYATAISPILGTMLDATTQNHSFGAFVIPPTVPANNQSLFGKGVVGAWSQFPAGGVFVNGINQLVLSWYNGASYSNISLSGVSSNKKYHVLYVFNNVTSFAYLYVNSVLIGFANPVVFGAGAAEVNQPYRVGYSGTTSAGMLGSIGSVKDATLWSRALIADDVRKEWLQYASMAQFQTGWGAKVSIANESTAGNFVGNGSTPFEILSGTWNLNTSTQFGQLTKTIECIAAGTLWLDNSFLRVNTAEGAYGSWQVRLTHNAGTSSYVGLTCSSKSVFASHNGYAMKLDAANVKTLIRHAAAVETPVVNLPAGEVSHIARRFDNVWSGFARADATPTSWVAGATATDATYTSSLGMCFTLNAGDRLSLSTVRGQNSLIKYLGEFSPAEV